MASQGGRSDAPRSLVWVALCSPDGRRALAQCHLGPQPQPEKDKKKRLGGLGRLRGDRAHQPADVEARRAQHRVQRVAF